MNYFLFIRLQTTDSETEQKTKFNQTSRVTFRPNSRGFATCTAMNSEGTAEIKANVIIGNDVEISSNIQLFTLNQTERIYFCVFVFVIFRCSKERDVYF